MAIWRDGITLDVLQAQCEQTLVAHLGIRFTELGPDHLTGTMPVDARTHQPFGILHGGASVVLAETLGSIAANCCLNPERAYALGMEINANHLRPVAAGQVTGTARPVYRGAGSQVWEIRIEDERGRLTCICRLTMAVRRHKGKNRIFSYTRVGDRRA